MQCEGNEESVSVHDEDRHLQLLLGRDRERHRSAVCGVGGDQLAHLLRSTHRRPVGADGGPLLWPPQDCHGEFSHSISIKCLSSA